MAGNNKTFIWRLYGALLLTRPGAHVYELQRFCQLFYEKRHIFYSRYAFFTQNQRAKHSLIACKLHEDCMQNRLEP